MDKDEMKNRISLALKDTILQQGFELICKENAELKLKLEALEGQTPWKDIKCKSEVIGKLTEAKEIIKTLLLIADNKVSQMEFQLCVADAKQFLNSEVVK